MKYKFRRRILYSIFRILGLLIFILPIDIGVALGKFLGRAVYFVLRKHRLQALANLRESFGSEMDEGQIKEMARGVFENLGMSLVELFNFPKINQANIDRFVEVEGLEKIDRALKSGKGAIVLVAHLGNWELLAAYFGLKGYPANAVARPVRYEKYEKLLRSLREKKNINIIPRQGSFRSIIRILKKNQIVGILPDQDIDNIDGVFVDFFGRKAYTPTGPVTLAMASGAPIIPCFAIRKNGKHRLVVEDPVELELTGDRQKDLLVNTARWSGVVERYIREFPSQWVWVHRRWKTTT